MYKVNGNGNENKLKRVKRVKTEISLPYDCMREIIMFYAVKPYNFLTLMLVSKEFKHTVMDVTYVWKYVYFKVNPKDVNVKNHKFIHKLNLGENQITTMKGLGNLIKLEELVLRACQSYRYWIFVGTKSQGSKDLPTCQIYST